MLPPFDEQKLSVEASVERQVIIGKLTKCWFDCAGVVVVEQGSAVSQKRSVMTAAYDRLRTAGLHTSALSVVNHGNAFEATKVDYRLACISY